MEIGFFKMNDVINKMKIYAKENNVPIITDDGLNYLLQYIRDHSVKNVLEVGTAIGYSAICMCSVSPDITVTSIERDENRYQEAIKNVHESQLQDRIHLIFGDALEVSVDGDFDLIFIDAAKAQNIKFFERFQPLLKVGGTIITDNMNFHGLVSKKIEEIESRNLRQLVRKVNNYKDFLIQNHQYTTEFYDIGDGLAVSIKQTI